MGLGDGLKDMDRMRFPLDSVDAVLALVLDQLDAREEPNLALLSIVLGAVEQSLTVNAATAWKGDQNERGQHVAGAPFKSIGEEWPGREVRVIPSLSLSTVEALYEQFAIMVRGAVDMSTCRGERYTSLECLKKVSDVVWEACPRTVYKDRVHLQSLYTLLTDSKLDCFGMAVSVVAACQLLGLTDVHLALTEDHTWAVFGENASETAEITWHGKGTEDRRGQPITDSVAEKNWLYLNPIVCSSRCLEVVAMVIGMNPSINVNRDSAQLAAVQQELLWVLYDRGLLNKFPMGLGTLADMEEMCPTPNRPSSLALYSLALDNTVKYCNDLYIYPYTYIGNYFYRHRQYREALKNWAAAAQVISRYNYNREDEVSYKEFLELANEIIPNVIRMSSNDLSRVTPANPTSSLIFDPDCYANLLRFYDGICKWEEGSSMPVLHIVWANHMCCSLAKFDACARDKVDIQCSVEDLDDAKRTSPESPPSEADTAARPKATGRDSVVLESPESPVECADRSGEPPLKLIPYADSPGGEASLVVAPPPPPPPPARAASKPPTERVTRLGDAAQSERVKVQSERIKVVLSSGKMMAMRELLVGEKLNQSAIKLQLTAQSQTHVKSSGGGAGRAMTAQAAAASNAAAAPRKRQRRD